MVIWKETLTKINLCGIESLLSSAMSLLSEGLAWNSFKDWIKAKLPAGVGSDKKAVRSWMDESLWEWELELPWSGAASVFYSEDSRSENLILFTRGLVVGAGVAFFLPLERDEGVAPGIFSFLMTRPNNSMEIWSESTSFQGHPTLGEPTDVWGFILI